MDAKVRLVLLSVGFAAWAWFCISNIAGRMAERTYDARMRRPLLRLITPVDRGVWIRQQKIIASIGLALGAVVYALAAVAVLS